MHVEELLTVARRLSGDAGPGEVVEVLMRRDRNTVVIAKDGGVDECEVGDAVRADVTVLAGDRQGYAGTSRVDDTSLQTALATARAHLAAADRMPPTGRSMAADDGTAVVHDLVDTDLAGLHLGDKARHAIDLERTVATADPRVVGVYTAGWEDHRVEAAWVSSSGAARAYEATRGQAFAYVIASDGTDTQVALARRSGRGLTGGDCAAVAADAVTHATRLLGASRPATTRTAVVLDPVVTAELLGFLGQTLAGADARRGKSPFATRLGVQAGAAGADLRDDPTDPNAPHGVPFDDEGVPTRRVDVLRAGRVHTLLHDRTSAFAEGLSSTGSAVRDEAGTLHARPRALFFVATVDGARDVVQSVTSGIYIQAVTGLHSGFDPVTGDLSFGGVGLAIRGGQLAEPLTGMVIATSVGQIVGNIVGVGNERLWIERAAGSTVVIDDVSVRAA